MKHLKLYEEYTSNLDHPGFFKTYEETKNWLDDMGVENYTIKDDLSVDVEGNVDLRSKGLKYIPVQFGKVDLFFLGYNNQLTNLIGSPRWVGFNFNCSNNQLTSLTGAPSYVGGSFDCSDNYLTSLTGGPSEVDGYFYCDNNQLTSLTGVPKINNQDNIIYNKNNYLTTDKIYHINIGNPGHKETSLPKIAQNFLDKLETSNLNNLDIIRILNSLKEYKLEVYEELDKLYSVDDWLSRLTNSEKNIDIINL